MINDPLLPPPPPPARTNATSTRTATRAKHPAMSARILATGLAATGTLGLTAGYALGARNDAAAPVLDNVSFDNSSGTQSVTPLAPAAPQQPTQSESVPQQAPRIIQLPVPGISPARPATSQGQTQQQAPAQQQSSGSH